MTSYPRSSANQSRSHASSSSHRNQSHFNDSADGGGGGRHQTQSGGSRSGHSRYRRSNSNRRQQPRQQPVPVEDPLKQYTFDEVTSEQIRALDIYPQVVDDLLLPGKGVSYLNQIITIADNQFKNKKGISFETRQANNIWVGLLTIHYPETRTFVCKNKTKKDCKNLCSLAAVYNLRKSNSVDAKLKLNIDTSVTNNFIDNSRGPVPVTPIPMNIKQQMMSFISKFDEYVSNLIEYRINAARSKYERSEIGGIEGMHSAILEGLELDEGIVNPDTTNSEGSDPQILGSGPVDIFTSRPYVQPDARKKVQSFAALSKVYSDRQRRYRSDKNLHETLQSQERLPIRSSKDDILDALDNNRVVVIAGDTGSGKSTQVPQFIFEEFIRNDKNANLFANIAITQPRRISAISLAERVAIELGEPGAGHSVGHNVRFDSRLPTRDLNIMSFFSTGMLLRKLQRNPDLKGVSHLIIDEVHERDCTTDFLLILIKRLLLRRRDLRVILMSASLDASLFAQYFNNCPVISVSGRCFPVDDRYLTDICREFRREPPRDLVRDRAPKFNLDLVTDLIRHIDETRNSGAVLCFMPGWKEMKALQKELDYCRSRNRLKVLLAHSKLPISEQRLIFGKPGAGERKVILATNIAETSITINDVCYVIDTGLCNSIDYNPELNMSTFGTRWISKANAKQRSGRAGRTCPGECFKLYTRDEESLFQDFPFPELLRIPLESVIMEAKSHCPDEKAANFLSQAIQHPSLSAIHNAIGELMLLGVLDNRENLTVLGRRIADFPTHPRLSVSLIVSSALRCLYPVLNASAILSSTQEPFFTHALIDKSQIRAIKHRLCTDVIPENRDPINLMSDHIAFGNLLAQYDNAALSKYESEYFIEENNLNKAAMMNIQECRNLYARMLVSAKFVSTYDWYSFDALPNRNMNDLELMVASLAHSFHPKVVRVIKGIMKGGRMYPNKAAPTDAQSNNRVRFASDSIVRNIAVGKQLSSAMRDEGAESDEDSDYLSLGDMSEDKRPMFITYLNSRVDQDSGQIVIRDGSVVPPMTLLLFGGRSLASYEPHSKSGEENRFQYITLDRLNLLTFKLFKEDAQVVQEWRNVWQQYLDWYIHTKNTSEAVDQNDSIIAGTMNEFLEMNKKLYASIS